MRKELRKSGSFVRNSILIKKKNALESHLFGFVPAFNDFEEASRRVVITQSHVIIPIK
jgi:hypothetical protein